LLVQPWSQPTEVGSTPGHSGPSIRPTLFAGHCSAPNLWPVQRISSSDRDVAAINPNIVRDHGALAKLREYDSATLDFVAKRLKLEASQFRKRITYIAPGIEKIGFVPSVLAGVLFFLKLMDSKDLPSWLHLPLGFVVGTFDSPLTILSACHFHP
jgi:hypothetical protein